ncbi:sulfate permease [Plantibacter auratus]|uniref:sulfate permease n=1 Tax=Plantibacter auratus TaxID=272914 RepID=UPI003D33AB17
MFRLIWVLSVRARHYLRRHKPTNILVDAIRTRRGLKWGTSAMLLALPYLLTAAVFRDLIKAGGPGWLNLLILVRIWNAMEMIIMGLVSVILQVRAKTREHV